MRKSPSVILESFISSPKLSGDWNIGSVLAESQNFARHLMDSPSNLMTPTLFASIVEKTMSGFNNISITS